jgi:hypothetical protein
MARPTKTEWNKPALKQLSRDDLLAIYDKATEDDRAELNGLKEQHHQYHLARERPFKARRSAAR